jgi:hypothetical protein
MDKIQRLAYKSRAVTTDDETTTMMSQKVTMLYHYRWCPYNACPIDIQIVALDIIREYGCSFNLITGFAYHPAYGNEYITKLAWKLLSK